MELSSEFQTSEAGSKGPRFRLSIFLFIFLTGLFASCDDGGKVLPAHSGRAGEVIVIMEDRLWNGPAGQAIKEALQQPFPMLPQLEPTFSVIHIDPDNVSYNFRIHRNIIVADIEDNARNTPLRGVLKEDLWAKGQVVYTFHALDIEGFIEKFKELAPSVIQDIRHKDRDRIQGYMASVIHPSIGNLLKDSMSLGLTIHRDYKLHTIRDDFAWMTRENIQFLSGVAHDVKQGIAVYVQPYVTDSVFSPESMMNNRNQQLAGEVISTYDRPMIIETLIPPTYEQVNFKDHYAVEGRGLWKFDRPIMGGPFVSLTVVDEESARLITVDGYVFAPKFDKRNFLLDVEAIAYSLHF